MSPPPSLPFLASPLLLLGGGPPELPPSGGPRAPDIDRVAIAGDLRKGRDGDDEDDATAAARREHALGGADLVFTQSLGGEVVEAVGCVRRHS